MIVILLMGMAIMLNAYIQHDAAQLCGGLLLVGIGLMLMLYRHYELAIHRFVQSLKD